MTPQRNRTEDYQLRGGRLQLQLTRIYIIVVIR